MILSILRTLLIYAAVVLAMRLMGKRQLGELQPSELVTTFLISNVASICIEEPELPLTASIVPIFLIASLEILNSCAVWLWPRYARLLSGRPITVIQNGEIDQNALAELRITASDLMEALRQQQIFSPQQVDWGVIETNGTLSVAEKSSGVSSAEPTTFYPVLIDRILYPETLRRFSLSADWVQQELQKRNLSSKTVLLFLYDGKTCCILPRASVPKGGSQ